jgi:sulfonate transport system ATP-binding protein
MAERSPILSIRHAKKNFQIGSKTVEVLDDINLEIQPGEFVSIVGSSGCGKSTLLKLIVALEDLTEGEILVAGEGVTEPSDKCNMVFQEPRLFPWLSVRQNIAFTIPKQVSKQERKKTVEDHIALVGLKGFEKAVPSQLSGGMQQRVNLARALATKPEILLLDEPFGALDAFTRINMQEEALRIWEAEKTTMLLVTHDIDEAIYLSDRIIVLSAKPGRIKADIPVALPRPRERSGYDFMQVRREVMLKLFEKQDGQRDFEYYI